MHFHRSCRRVLYYCFLLFSFFLSPLAVFIIPYLLMLVIVGVPMFYLETLLGQATQKGPILAWYKICPNLWGLGLAAVFVTTFISLYYNVIISWVILYFFNSFQEPLPWGKCEGYVISTDISVNLDYWYNLTEEDQTSNLASCINDSTRYCKRIFEQRNGTLKTDHFLYMQKHCLLCV